MTWRAIVTALDEGIGLHSRVSVYAHPLAGWPIVWHIIGALGSTDTPPDDILVLHRSSVSLELTGESRAPVRTRPIERGEDVAAIRAALDAPGLALLVDGCAPLIEAATIARVLRAAETGIATLSLGDEAETHLLVGGEARAIAAAEDPRRPAGARRVIQTETDECIRVVDRHTLSEAATAIQRRVIRAHESRGVTFMLPSTIWVDADVRIGADTVIYPGAVIEGRTEIGTECVIGPHSRLVEATIGSGVELKGWNYVTRTSIRSHAVLEPYVRRGFD
ncbi:MAG: NTP transferase domain-containing protein [Gemmatimonadota bacterium]|nr:NTP transferase domain-containing protein [Gemmatimonadota bacterium]